MRNFQINIQQVIVIITGLLYLSVGICYMVRPQFIGTLLTVTFSAEWANQIRIDNFLIMLYLFSKTFAILITCMGLSMILPLYDPIRYRELIYFNNVFMPFVMAVYMIKQTFVYHYTVLIYVALFFVAVIAINMSGLFLTKRFIKR